MALYLYRITHTIPANVTPKDSTQNLGYFQLLYSADSGSTYVPIFPYTFQSYIEAQQAAQRIIDNEDSFKTFVDAGAKNGFSFPCTVLTFTYPT